jgi:hypothetical protein
MNLLKPYPGPEVDQPSMGAECTHNDFQEKISRIDFGSCRWWAETSAISGEHTIVLCGPTPESVRETIGRAAPILGIRDPWITARPWEGEDVVHRSYRCTGREFVGGEMTVEWQATLHIALKGGSWRIDTAGRRFSR